MTSRFLRPDERFIISKEHEMPLVIEAKQFKDASFLHTFLMQHSTEIIRDLSTYGAILLRGFDINSDEAFEQAILSIQGFEGISDVFMSEEGRDHVDHHSFVLHTNSVYKTGGTLYLGGFHGENYYSPDVPAYICFCCLKPSIYGGETGLINTKSVYDHLDPSLQQRLENNNFMASLWLVSEVAQRYQLSTHVVEEVCQRFHLPLVGSGVNRFIVMYKPNVFVHPDTGTKAFQINFFEIKGLNKALRRFFAPDYPGKRWFWHRFFWRLPSFMLSILEKTYMSIASFIHSPKDSFNILRFKWRVFNALKANPGLTRASIKVDSCFNDKEVNKLARLMREHYSSCLWQTGDILLIDNRQVAHAGMPGAGSRLVRAIICNPLDMQYDANQSGLYNSQNKDLGTIAAFIQALKK